MRSSTTAELIFDDVRVPMENRLGEEGLGFKIAMMPWTADAMGLRRRPLVLRKVRLKGSETMALHRHQFGAPLANLQAIQFKLADMAIKIEATRLLTYQAACLESHGHSYA